MSASAFGTALALSSLSMRPGEGTLDASDDSQAIELHDDGHSHSLLRSFQRLREVDMLCDLTLRVDGGLAEYRVHRALLCAACPYFETMFMCGLQESTSACVDLHVAPVPAHIVGLLIDYFYTGTVKLRGGEFELLPLLVH
jgi:kelch repeat/BTB domain-containing protein 6/7